MENDNTMDKKELRIGNWVNFRGHNVMVTELKEHSLSTTGPKCLYESITPVMITPDVLDYAGFIKDELKDHFYHPRLPIQILLRYNGTFAGTQLRTRTINDIKENSYQLILSENCRYIHQLQNICFALNKMELEFNLSNG